MQKRPRGKTTLYSGMNLQSEKLAIAQLVLATENKSILYQIRTIFEAEKVDLWDELPNNVKADIDTAILQSKAGMGKSHKEGMKKYKNIK